MQSYLLFILEICALGLQMDGSLGNDNKDDFRFIPFEDIQSTMESFRTEEYNTSYSQMLFDVSRNHIIVGVRDGIYRLSLSHLKLKEYAEWKAPEHKRLSCINKGQSEENCHNYIKILQSNGRKLFVCGTNAFSPQCSWREIENISAVTEIVDGIAKCPYNPSVNITSLLLDNGDYYFGGPTDFSCSDYLISRSVNNAVIRTKQYNNFWLNEPQFVGSFETASFVYFLFREPAVEYMNCGKAVFSRIARVCKNDIGGVHTMFKDNWTTFIKARLNCSSSGDYPFYFDEIQSMSYVSNGNIIFATFTTSSNSIAGSAVCAFNLSAINEAFNGPFKYQHDMNSAWNKHHNTYKEHFQCGPSKRTNLLETSMYQLMDTAVHATTINPLYEAKLERFSHIAVDVLETRSGTVTVIFVASLEGLIKKLTLLPYHEKACLVEIWQAVPSQNSIIKQMQFLKETNSIYVATNAGIAQITASHCGRYETENNCRKIQDPYCGWNERAESCTVAPEGDYFNRFWKQFISMCPSENISVDGGWSSWSDWKPCDHHLPDNFDSSTQCQCRNRKCDNPSPKNGEECLGPSIAVTNCTVHGGWSNWSAWSACSATCGVAVRTKTRTCTSPAPAFGGRVCVGQDRSEELCTELLPCPTRFIDGGWGVWSPWSECTANCGGGYKLRERKCNNPTPSNGGSYCKGNHIEYERCNEEPCSEQKKVHLTEWLSDRNISSAIYHRKRFKIICKAPVRHPNLLKVIVRDEEQFCQSENSCENEDHEFGDWSSWSSWSSCSVKCGSGVQTRNRHCKTRSNCVGESVQTRTCYEFNCDQSDWGCWSHWSACNVSCGWGARTRTRECLGQNCIGSSMEEQTCQGHDCEKVSLSEVQMQEISCVSVGFSFFFIGMIVGLLPSLIYLTYYFVKRRKPTIPGSPHYIMAEQNTYISVPTKDQLTRKPSSVGSSLYSNSPTKAKYFADDYEIPTTLKRQSHEVRNGHFRQDSDNYLYS